jgi:arylsulfatase A-like enzyme
MNRNPTRDRRATFALECGDSSPLSLSLRPQMRLASANNYDNHRRSDLTPSSAIQPNTRTKSKAVTSHRTPKYSLRIVLFSVFAALGAADAAESSKPNILVIFTDDHGWADLGANGVNEHIRTPNVDRLAADGVRFPNGYVTAPQCTPSRAGLMTGRYQNRFGVEHNGIPMRSEVVTLPERLKAAGYVTGISGKWHLDIEDQRGEGGRKNVKHPELGPWGQGFDEYFSGFMQDYEVSHGLDGRPYPDAPKKVREEGCRVVLQTEWALQFLKRRAAEQKQPWFLYLSYMAPHTPLEWPEPYISQVPKNLPKERRSALALIAAIDDGVGRIRQLLRAMGEEENTLVFYLGDNGAPLAPINPREGQRNPWDGSLNLPMRGQKGMLSEGGIRVPFVAAWPGTIPDGQVFNHPVISLDIAATSVAAAGLPIPKELDGTDLLPHLTRKHAGPPHRTLYWRWMSQAAVQKFPWKLIVLGGQENLLFDITQPEGEDHRRNLIEKHPDIAARLEGKLRTWTATLQPPGMPPALADHHVRLFADHALSTPAADPAKPASQAEPEGSIQGWICRNGTIVMKDRVLVITPAPDLAKNARPFLAKTGLDLAGPVTVTLRLRARTGGPSTITWRTKTASFTPEQSTPFDWPAGNSFQEVKLELPERSRLIHLRITPAKSVAGAEIKSVHLRGKTGEPLQWQFEKDSPANGTSAAMTELMSGS